MGTPRIQQKGRACKCKDVQTGKLTQAKTMSLLLLVCSVTAANVDCLLCQNALSPLPNFTVVSMCVLSVSQQFYC